MITIEDGSGIADANSYLTVSECRDFARFRGVNMSGKTDPEIETYINRAIDYLQSKSEEYIGEKTYPDVQALAWPRTYNNKNQGIPGKLKSAQGYLVIAVFQGNDLMPTLSKTANGVKRRKAGELEIEYFSSLDSPGGAPQVLSAEQMLAPLLIGYRAGGGLRSVRV